MKNVGAENFLPVQMGEKNEHVRNKNERHSCESRNLKNHYYDRFLLSQE